MNKFWCCCTALHLVPRLPCFPQNQSIDPDWPPSFAARPFPPSSRVASHSSGFLGMIGLRMPATPATRFSRFSHPKWSKSCGRNLKIILKQKWGLPKMGVPKSSILEGFSTVNTSFLGMETPILNPVISLWTLNSIGILTADQMNPVADLQPRGKWIQMEVCNISPGEPFPATKRDVLLPLSDKNLLLWTRICMMFCSSNCWFKRKHWLCLTSSICPKSMKVPCVPTAPTVQQQDSKCLSWAAGSDSPSKVSSFVLTPPGARLCEIFLMLTLRSNMACWKIPHL